MTAIHETWHLIAHGRVQGVGYRAACADRAVALGLVGWVRNRTDGTVEVIAQGPRDPLEALRTWMAAGPPAAQVSKVEMTPADDEGPFSGFRWLPTA
ncbi:acylphosphatase [Cupriavidus sp. OV038]|jgi:acylphosphatase|uniref:acylphosphatase n=1 Tax=unclassified Cupriavidus TaxID=2640874 RepID=UPI0008EC93DA|nr:MULTISPECIES: acylphosphatase [unclassified Cupriavidus]SFD20118.1 acylphosphatase [Cupriavidus sp. OV038]SFP86478.1 acylphosphatase [Cupriavidus sp. OV096]